MLGGYHVTEPSEVTNMKFTFRRRSFLNPISTTHTSYIDAVVESSQNGEYQVGSNILTLADCHRVVRIEFFLATKKERRRSLTKINLLIDTLTRFRDALIKESDLIEKAK
jgi:hypothetical protein